MASRLWAMRVASYLRISVPCRGFATVLKDLKYVDSHERVKVEGKSATIGITYHAPGKEELNSSPALINGSPYEKGWIIKVELEKVEELGCLMDSGAYTEFCEEEDASELRRYGLATG
ncbi:hypothetical protein ACS0TY_032272 [Phlomoides rotata]